MSTISTMTEQRRLSHLNHRPKSNTSLFLVLLQRSTSFSQMDWEYAMATVAELIWSPSRVYKLAQSRHEIKGHWSRDDPAFVLILCAFIVVDFLAYGFALDEEWGVLRVLRHFAVGLGFFFGVGTLVGTCTWYLSNKYFQTRHPHASRSQQVEWFYAFDVHCNAFLPAFLLLGVVQYMLLPFLVRGGILPALLSNTLHLAAGLAYVHITVLGFLHLPFLNKDKVTLLWNPAFGLVLVWFLLTLFNANLTRLFFFRVF